MPEAASVSVRYVNKRFRKRYSFQHTLKDSILYFFSNEKNYEELAVLKDISFTADAGDFIGIVGRNGSGKTTLLKIIADIYKPSSGIVEINGSLIPLIALGFGFHGELTGRENVYLYGSILGLTKKQIDSRYQAIVEFSELENFMEMKMKYYSSGMLERLGFSVAIQAEADILLIDELLSAGDVGFKEKCYGIYERFRSKNKVILMVSHDMNQIKRFCSKAMLIENGEIMAIGPPAEIIRTYQSIIQTSEFPKK